MKTRPQCNVAAPRSRVFSDFALADFFLRESREQTQRESDGELSFGPQHACFYRSGSNQQSLKFSRNKVYTYPHVHLFSRRFSREIGGNQSQLVIGALQELQDGNEVPPKETLGTRIKSRRRAKVANVEAGEDLETDGDFIKPKRPVRPVMERFNIYHEEKVSEERLKETDRLSKWECGTGVTFFWQWKVDELVHISKGSMEVVPDDCYYRAFFYAEDLVHFLKWFEATLAFDENYEQHYKFLAYDDDRVHS